MNRQLEYLDISEPEGVEFWHEYFECYVATNDKIVAANKMSWYLMLIRKDTYNLLKDLAFPNALGTYNVGDLNDLLMSHIRPSSFKLTECMQFYNLIQYNREAFYSFYVSNAKLQSTTLVPNWILNCETGSWLVFRTKSCRSVY